MQNFHTYARQILVIVIIGITFFATSLARAGGEIKILAFGDSLTAGYGLDAEDAFPAQLQAALLERGHSVIVINAGVSGDTSTGGRERLDWTLNEPTDGVILELGANDALRGVNPDVTREALDEIIQKLHERELPVLLAGMQAPPNMGHVFVEKFNPIYFDLAAQYDLLLYPFFLDGVAAEPNLNQADGIHPNAEGVAIIVERILPKVEELIELIKANG